MDALPDAVPQVPLVSCIMPTRNRRAFAPRALRQFLDQDYPSRELIVLDDGSDPIGDLVPEDPRIRYVKMARPLPLGAKRNLACEHAAGEVIAHWDDDDWMSRGRLSRQVHHLLREGADACGLDRLFFYEPATGRAWEYTYVAGQRPWVAGGTLCYTKAFWRGHRFAEINVGEDNELLWRHRPRTVVLEDRSFYVALIHRANTSPKQAAGPFWKPIPRSSLPEIDFESLVPPRWQEPDPPRLLRSGAPWAPGPGVARRRAVVRKIRF